jgi:hypothetical protein
MNTHPLITQQIASARQHELLAAAAHRRVVRRFAERSIARRAGHDARRPALGARPPKARRACC